MYDYRIQEIDEHYIRVGIKLDGPNDAIIQDILSDISQTGTVYVEGFIFEVASTQIVSERSTVTNEFISALILESGRVNVRGKANYTV